jgi:hypothetical protein
MVSPGTLLTGGKNAGRFAATVSCSDEHDPSQYMVPGESVAIRTRTLRIRFLSVRKSIREV